jgi:hypothetical protein
MSKRFALVCALALAGLPAIGEEGKPARVYTNEDLDRVAPRRGETGVLSRPAAVPARKSSSPEPAERVGGAKRSEDYWRREAARVQAQVRTLQEQVSRLREQIERAAHRSSGGKSRPGRVREAWAAEDDRARRLRDLETRARELESNLEDRARREGVPPGWLR